MKNVWHYNKLGDKLLAAVCRRKVKHVVQNKNITGQGYCYWSGEFDDEDYFIVHVLDGLVMLTVADNEDKLKIIPPTPVACVDQMQKIMDEKDFYKKIQKTSDAVLKFIPEFLSNLTFKEIMDIFMWEYASPSVEIYEYTFV